MPSPKEKTGILLLGIFLGILIAGSIFWWQRSIYSVDWISFGRMKQFVNSFVDQPDDFLAQLKTRIISGGKSGRNRQSDNVLNDSLNKNPGDSLALHDSLYNYYNSQGLDYYIDYNGLPDSLLDPLGQGKLSARKDSLGRPDSSNAKVIARYESMAVKRDMILGFRVIRISGLSDSVLNASAFLDSLLTDDRKARRTVANQLRVEFWKSPINYKGYKLSKEKLVLFGIYEYEDAALEIHKQQLYLRNKNNAYLLKNANDFQPLIPAKSNDKALLNKKT